MKEQPRRNESSALSPAQLRKIDWTEEEEPRLPVRRDTTYVPAAADLVRTPRVDIVNPDTHIGAEILPASTVDGRTHGSHVDRANAWLRYSLPLSVAMAVLMTIVAVGLYNVPLLSWAALITFGITFVVAYGLLLARYWQTSPEGVALTHTKLLWAYLKREQLHRQRIERQAWDQQRKMLADKHNKRSKQ